jgi:pimeloyl-ACP methyl ester carboxylesterase
LRKPPSWCGLEDIRAAIGGYPSAKELAAISTPVVCTCGRRSAQTMVRVTKKLADVVPTGSLREIEAAGHAAPFDQPVGFAKVIEEAMAVAQPRG